jgi:hypothetical protein
MLRSRRSRGNAIIEFAISLPFLVLLSVGVFATGVMLDRHLTVAQLVRHAGNMYGRGIDFSQDRNKQLLLQAATGMNVTVNSGEAVIYLTMVTRARPNGAGENRPNANLAVIAHRIVIGNGSLAPSSIGMPVDIQPDGEVNRYDNDNISARATLPAGLTLAVDEKIYIAEVFHTPVDLGFSGIFAPRLLYSRAMF